MVGLFISTFFPPGLVRQQFVRLHESTTLRGTPELIAQVHRNHKERAPFTQPTEAA